MTGSSAHSRLITQVAREVLRPLGLVQKGRSRVWLDDNQWWLGVVEFQPSAWSRGTYLNVGVMWLWRDTEDHYVYFDLGHRVDPAGFAEYDPEAEDEFVSLVHGIARKAAAEIERFRELIPDIAAAAELLRVRAVAERGWALWDAAVAHGLAGRRQQAAALFRQVADDDDDRDWWVPVQENAAHLETIVLSEPEAFRAEVGAWIDRYREALKLGPAATYGEAAE